MSRGDTAFDPARCPLCGGPNGCAMLQPPAAGGALSACWCAQASFSPDLLARLPPEARRRVCICADCAAAEEAKTVGAEP
ncbi:MAG: cysteine-rich CWC family protein [Burkholderiaceae bacterium]|nr:cysteine-rich CWC family protein [Burkholderiaceae bacterium]